MFTSLLNSESLVDVTLAAEGKHLQAHKVVLSACSSYFQVSLLISASYFMSCLAIWKPLFVNLRVGLTLTLSTLSMCCPLFFM